MKTGYSAVCPIKRLITILLCLVMSSAFALTVAAYGAESSKAVRVGWYESPFNRTNQFGRKSGFAYEY